MASNSVKLSENPSTNRRYLRTLNFLQATLPAPASILDIGGPNPFADILKTRGYDVTNTDGDLDETPDIVQGVDAEATTAFEILEHLVSPMPLLRALPGERLFASIPMRLWFAAAYHNPKDPWDRHYHEFEDWQFDWLLEKGGWTIVRSEKWTSPVPSIGWRPLLRRFVPRYYIVEAVRA
jgi:hypothetical protein